MHPSYITLVIGRYSDIGELSFAFIPAAVRREHFIFRSRESKDFPLPDPPVSDIRYYYVVDNPE